MKRPANAHKKQQPQRRRRISKSDHLVRNSYWLVRDKLETSRYGKWKVTDLPIPEDSPSAAPLRDSLESESNEESLLTSEEESTKSERLQLTEEIQIKNEDFDISPVLVNRLTASPEELKRKSEWIPDIALQLKENESLSQSKIDVVLDIEEKKTNGINSTVLERNSESNSSSSSKSDSSWSVDFDDLNKVTEDEQQDDSHNNQLITGDPYPSKADLPQSTQCSVGDQELATREYTSAVVSNTSVIASTLESEDSDSEPETEPIARSAPSISPANAITIVSSDSEPSPPKQNGIEKGSSSSSSEESDSDSSSEDSSSESSSSSSSEDSSSESSSSSSSEESDSESSKPIVQYTRDTIPKHLMKYWNQRFKYFSKFNEGIQMDEEGWYSVTPEKIATHIARRCQCGTIIDAFCGVGGNAIQFAFYCERVIAIDIDETRLNCARNNARVYGVENRIEFIHGNYLELLPKLKADVVFLSPPWGGPEYNQVKVFDLRNMPIDGVDLYHKTTQITHNIAYFVPRNTDPNQLADLAGPGNTVEAEQQKLYGAAKSITAYYGDLQLDCEQYEDPCIPHL